MISSERRRIAAYLGQQLGHLYEQEEYGLVPGVQWAIGRILGREPLENEPAPGEELDGFLGIDEEGV